MFEHSVCGVAVEVDTSGAFDAGARSGVEVYLEEDPAVTRAGVVALERMLARWAAFRAVSPDWPAPGSLWVGHVPGPELAALAIRRLADPALTQAQRLDCIDALQRSANAILGFRTAAVAEFINVETRDFPAASRRA